MNSCRSTPLRIVKASSLEQVNIARELMLEYWQTLNLPATFQGFASEMTTLPGKYAAPTGRIGLALIGDKPAGCVAFRQIDADRCEAKRLYVRSRFRGQGVGAALLHWLIAEARGANYAELVCDTLPSMSEAVALYESGGVTRIAPYGSDPTPGALYFSLTLA